MKFTLEIELGNEAMQTYDHIADALYGVRQNMQGVEEEAISCYPHTIYDVNGNTVGKWEVKDDADEESEDDATDEVCPKCGEKGVAFGAHCHMVD